VFIWSFAVRDFHLPERQLLPLEFFDKGSVWTVSQ
jgi:hypothetical protein